MMKKFIGACVAAGAMAIVSVPPALSHHSHAMFDHSREIAVEGTVKQWLLRNPHAFLYIDVKTETGEVVNYSIEMSNVQNMITRGFSQTTFKPGDKIIARVHPLKDGRPGGNYVTITTADGKTYD